MKTNYLLVLIAVAVGAVLAAIWLKRPQEPLALIGQGLVPELKQNINQVTVLRVTRAGNQTVADIERAEQGWLVRNKDNYPADMGRVRETLLLLANARLLEEKTADPQYYSRLGVQDIAAPDAAGVQLTIEGLSAPFSLIVGKSAGGAGGAYIRRPGDARSFQIDTRITAPASVKDWLERSVLDISAGRIQAISIRQPDGQTLSLEKGARNQANFTVLNIPAGQSLKADTVANPLANGLAGLWLDDVFPAGAVKPANDQVTEAVYRAFDGLVITARLFQADNKRYAQFKADFDEAQASRFAPAPAAAKATDAPASGADTAQSAAARDEAKRLTERLSPWVYVISAYKYDTLAKRMDHLLKSAQPETEETVTTPSPQGQPEEEDAPAADNATVEESEEAMPEESGEGEEMAPTDQEAGPEEEAMPHEEEQPPKDEAMPHEEEQPPEEEAMPNEEEQPPEEDAGGAEEQPQEEVMPPDEEETGADEAQPSEEEIAPEEENDAR